MALVALQSLMTKIATMFLDESFPSYAPATREITEFAYRQVHSIDEIARKMLLSTTSRGDLEIRVAASRLMEKLYSQTATHVATDEIIDFTDDQLKDLRRDIDSLAQLVTTMQAAERVEESSEGGGDDDDDDSSTHHSGGSQSKMVGLSDQYRQLFHQLTFAPSRRGPSIVVLVGMPGIGKTTLAGEIFEDPDIVKHYDLRVWVAVGRKCQLKEIPRRILAEVNPRGSSQILAEGDDEKICACLKRSLEGKRYLIVLDDVWNRYTINLFDTIPNKYGLCKSNPVPTDDLNEGRVLITTRVHQQDTYGSEFMLRLRLLNEQESWDLLREKVFAGDQSSCPRQLEEAGKKIAENCDGLPLTILAVAQLLSQKEMLPEFWMAVAAKKNHQIFMDAYDKISKVLYPSYCELTRVLRFCFLYMGIFRQNLEIRVSKAINMLNVDGFLEPEEQMHQKPRAIECLDELVSNSVLTIYQNTSGLDKKLVGRHEIKSCGLHSSLWHLSRREAEKNKFCHVLSVVGDCSDDKLQGQSRLSFHNNVLFGIRDVCELVEETCAPARSLFCYGTYHQYQVPVCFGLKLLRELDAVAIRFYEFPIKVLQLVELKYLALTLNGELPASISKLSKLQYLIVERHMSIKSAHRGPSYLPVEIWNMKELKHIQVVGSDLPNPRGSLENLLILKGVSVVSCSERVLKAIPNLQKLGIRIELVIGGGRGITSRSFRHIHHLKNLTSLKCVVVNPGVVGGFPQLSISHPNLKKLSLSGLGCSWGEMSNLELPVLHVLKLRNYAFRGPLWVLEKDRFKYLGSLIIEDTDLKVWVIGSESIYLLKSLRLKHCYQLKEVHWGYGVAQDEFHMACVFSLKKIELLDCNPSVIKYMDKALPLENKAILSVHSSWEHPQLHT